MLKNHPKIFKRLLARPQIKHHLKQNITHPTFHSESRPLPPGGFASPSPRCSRDSTKNGDQKHTTTDLELFGGIISLRFWNGFLVVLGVLKSATAYLRLVKFKSGPLFGIDPCLLPRPLASRLGNRLLGHLLSWGLAHEACDLGRLGWQVFLRSLRIWVWVKNTGYLKKYRVGLVKGKIDQNLWSPRVFLTRSHMAMA